MAIIDKPFSNSELIKNMEEASASSIHDNEIFTTNKSKETIEEETTSTETVDKTVDTQLETNSTTANNDEDNQKYLTLKDGTDISSIENLVFRKALSSLTKKQLQLWHESDNVMWFYHDKKEYGMGCSIMSGDYIFPEGYDGLFFGFVLQITEKQYNGTKYWYIDLAIGNDIKTIRCTINGFNDVVKKGIVASFGKCFEMNDLIYQAVSVRISNNLDSENNVTYTNIVKFEFLTDTQIDCLDCGYEAIKNL